MVATIGSQNLLELGIFNSLVPKEGPKVLPVRVDFSVENSYRLDLTQQTQLAIVAFIQCVFVDNASNPEPLYLQTETSLQRVVIPARSQAFVPLLAVKPPVVLLESAGGVAISLHFLNVPMPLHIWSVVAAPTFAFDDDGYLQVAVPALQALIQDPDGSGNGLGVHVLSGGGGGGGSGLRLPANYRAIRSDHDSTTTINVIAAAPRFYVNAISIYADATAYRTASPGPVTITVYQGISDRINRTVNFGGAAVAAPSQPFALAPILELSGLDWWSDVDGENLRIGLTAGLSQGYFRCTIWGGSGSVP